MWHKLLISAVILVFTHNQAFAKELFISEFDVGTGLLKYVGKGAPHPGGGYVRVLGGEIGTYYTPSDGCGGLSVQDVIIDSSPAAQGGPAGAQGSALKTQYRAFDNCGQSFQKNTTIITIPETQEIYVRFYQKWSSKWIWPTIQQKFCKIANQNKTSSQNFYFKKDGVMSVNYVKLGTQTTTFDPPDDDLASNVEIDLPINQWHEVQMHVKMSDPGKSNGVIEYWMNGIQRFGLYNIENNNGSTNGLDHIELQHVYETGSPKSGPSQDMPTWMKNIVVSTAFIPSECPLCPKPPSDVQAVKK